MNNKVIPIKKYDGTPLYANNTTDVREEIGYHSRPTEPWARQVIYNSKKRSDVESPLKQWWLEQKEKEDNKRQ